MMNGEKGNSACPVTSFDRAEAGYADFVRAWLENPHAAFKAFGPEARAFQSRYRSDRLRTMTLVATAAELAPFRPVRLGLDGQSEEVGSWGEAFSLAAARLITAHPQTFVALQAAGELVWLGCPAGETPVDVVLEEGLLRPSFADMAEVVYRLQWLFLMCGIRLNEALVQVDPFTDAEWKVRREELRRKRAEEHAFMTGRRAAQRAWAARQGRGDDGCGNGEALPGDGA